MLLFCGLHLKAGFPGLPNIAFIWMFLHNNVEVWNTFPFSRFWIHICVVLIFQTNTFCRCQVMTWSLVTRCNLVTSRRANQNSCAAAASSHLLGRVGFPEVNSLQLVISSQTPFSSASHKWTEPEEGASTFQKKARGKYENETLGAIVNAYSGFMCSTISSCHNY